MDIKFLREFSKIFEYKTIIDEFSNEYVLFKNSEITVIENIDDKTAFEAMENHVHLIDNVHKKDIQELAAISNIIGNIVLNNLKVSFPSKEFIVYISITVHDSMIVRFHQKWADELPYYDVTNFNSRDDIVLSFER